MSGAEEEAQLPVSTAEQVLVLLATIVLYAVAVFCALFVLVLLGAPEGDNAGLLVGTTTVLVSLVMAISARSSHTAGRVAMVMALAIPAGLALYALAGG